MSYAITRTKDLKLYLGTVCNGSIAAGSTALTAAGYLTAADEGNPVWVLGAGADTSPSTGDNAILYSTISSVEDADSCTIADAAITGIETGFNIVIVWRPVQALVDSIKLTRSLTVRDALDFNIQQLVTEGTPVLLADQTDVLFGGVVQKSRANNIPGTDDVDSLCTCVGWDYLFSKRQSGLFTYEDMSAGDVFAQLIVNSLGADYIGVQIDDAGPVIPSITFDYEPCSSAADRIVSLCNTELDTYYWYVDPLRVAHLAKQSTTAAPWGVDDADGSDENIRIEVSVERSNEKRYNRVYIKATQLLGIPVTEGIDGDGSSKQFSVSAPIGQEPTIELNGSAQTVGIQGVDTGKDWYWNKGSNFIYQDDAGATLSAGDHLSVVYKPYTEGLALYNYSTDVDAVSAVEGGTGYYEKVVTVTAPTTEASINALAEALAKKFGTKITAITATTNRGGLKPGMLWPVALSELDIDGSYLIDQVSLTSTSSVCYWTIHAVGSPLIGDWRKAFIDLAKEDTDTRGAGAGNGGGGTIPPPAQNPLDLIIEPLQGDVDGVNRLFTASYAARLSPTTGKPMRWVHRNQNTLCPFPAIASPVTSIDYSNYGEGQFWTEGVEVVFAVAPQIGDRPWTSYFRDYNAVPDDGSDRTGVWLAMATSGEIFGTEYIHVHSGYADDSVASPPSAIVGVAGGRAPTRIDVALTSPLSNYPTVGLGDLMPPPFDETDEAYIEWPQINAYITHLQGADHDNPSESPAYTAVEVHMMSGDMHDLDGPHTDITKWFGTTYGSLLVATRITSASAMGYRDDNANTIPEDLLSWWMKYVNYNSGFSGAGTPATLDVYANYLALYYRPVRIRCGGAALQTMHLNWPAQYPNASKTYTWGADRRYSGGSAAAGYIGTEGPYWERWPLFSTIRQGADFTYTIPRNLFRDYYDTVRYKVEIGLADPTATGAGQNVFSVLANGAEKLADIDIWNETNPGAPVLEKSFEYEMGSFDNGGEVKLRFLASAGMAKVSYINVLPMVPTGVVG